MSSEKYDRQLRLWASTGQANLEQSHICLINATVTGSEILKNLILPGVGKFTIIDSSTVREDDITSNFFLTKKSLGEPKAKEVWKYLKELNEDTIGNYEITEVSNFPDDYWDQFNIVVVSDYLSTKSLSKLKAILFEKGIPLLIVNTVGYYGTIHLVVNEVAVIETHTNRLYDLRIDEPWQELKEYCDSFDINQLDDTDHAHVPAVIIFIKALEAWRLNHQTKLPITSKDKAEFKSYIQSMSRNINFETNFIEAIETIHRVYRKTEVPSYLLDLFSKKQIKDEKLSPTTQFFWILIKALKKFVSKHHKLPLPGTLPDMASDTKNYVTLQHLYRKKASEDKEELMIYVSEILHTIRGTPPTNLEVDLLNSFCKNLQNLHVAEGSDVIFNSNLIRLMVSGTSSEYDNDEVNTLGIYFGLLCYNEFITVNNRVPCIDDLTEFTNLFMSNFDISSNLPNGIINVLKEILFHNVNNYENLCSLIGGIASQEVLKLTTLQYIPLDNMLVFDGIRSITSRYKIQ